VIALTANRLSAVTPPPVLSEPSVAAPDTDAAR
jgi:hypothetical protein